MKCMICGTTLEEKKGWKELGVVDKNGKISGWILCPSCYDLWKEQDYCRLAKRMR